MADIKQILHCCGSRCHESNIHNLVDTFIINPLVLLIFNSKKGLGTPGFKKLFEISLLSLSLIL